MNKIIFTIFFLIFNQILVAQIFDNFSDGDFVNNPTWYGDESSFCVNANQQLQLNALIAGDASLLLPVTLPNDICDIRLFVEFKFSPSTNNYSCVFMKNISTDLSQIDLMGDTSAGIYLQMGENLSNDALELFYKRGTESISICRGTEGLIASAIALNIKLLYHPIGLWEIWVDESLNGNYRLDASGICPEIVNFNTLGLYCKYTSSNISKFYFDNIYCGPQIIDTIPPKINQITGNEDGRSVTIKYSESVTPETALNTNNYLIDNRIRPDSASFTSDQFSEVVLVFQTPLEDRIEHQLEISEIKDMSENQISDSIYNFQCISIRRNDIIITEIMADPSPIVNLPECEYLEIFNRGVEDTAVLIHWTLQIGNNTKELPEIKIPPREYALILGNAFSNYFTHLPFIFCVSSLSIANDGQTIALYNQRNEVMHSVSFMNSWHNNVIKQNGGWSLEMKDVGNPCGEKDNWDSSTSENGGTPGEENSIITNNEDYLFPIIKKVTVLDSVTVKVFFSETIINGVTKFNFQIDKDIIIESVSDVPPTNSSFILHLANCLELKTIYTISITDSIVDCVGNQAVFASFNFAIPEKVDSFDLVINELLFNPFNESNADFIEIYNRSDKVIDLSEILIGVGGTNFPDKAVVADGSGFQLFPSNYVVISKNAENTLNDYYVANKSHLISSDSLPAFSNSEGIIYLTDRAFRVIDKIMYDEKMHYPMLISTDGVSLERVHFNRKTQDENNWKSSAESNGFATPTYQNSQYSDTVALTEQFYVSPEVFSPNNDGFDDFSEIFCNFSESENRVSIGIYDKNGNLVKQLVNNKICNKNEIFLWDGISKFNQIVAESLYLIKIDYWNMNGKRSCKKKFVGVVR